MAHIARSSARALQPELKKLNILQTTRFGFAWRCMLSVAATSTCQANMACQQVAIIASSKHALHGLQLAPSLKWQA
jgi:hypothetical protein